MAQALRIPQPPRIDWHAPKGASAFDFTEWLAAHLKLSVQIRRDDDGDIDVAREWMRGHSFAIDVSDAEEVAHKGTLYVSLPCNTADGGEDVEDVTVTYERLLCAERVDGQWVEHFQVEVDCG